MNRYAASILSQPIELLKGVGPDRAQSLGQELGIYTFGDLLVHFPFRYVDRTSIFPIARLHDKMHYCQITGVITKVEEVGEGKKKRLQAILEDETGRVELVWFKSLRWIKKIVRPGAEFLVFGKPASFNGRINIVHPELDSIRSEARLDEKVRLQPVYSTTEKLKTKNLDSRGIARLVENLLPQVIPQLRENLPQLLLQRFKLMPRAEAYKTIHFPENGAQEEGGRKRLKFEELFFLQLRILQTRQERLQKIAGKVFEKVGPLFTGFFEQHLPFELTGAQKRVLREIRLDMKTGCQMNRLLQGDVGSGKTIVALMSMLLALDNGTQACLMAPTEILATQHYHNIRRLLQDTDVEVRLLTGSTSQAERRNIAEALIHGTLPILIGTHALLEKWVEFPDLGLVVIDEQHRFGVAQRARLWGKSQVPPHVLVMTATPIPRTLAMTVYGDLDTSVLDELPPGRKEIRTVHRFENKRSEIYQFIKNEIELGRQAYIVYPLIEESEKLDYQNLQAGFDELLKVFPLPKYRLGMLHGQMPVADKEYEMQRFKKGETHILVSTTVIEVGVDVPNASVMVIESAERFGLSQLHQLRGRVGRGAEQSYCILLTGYKLSHEGRIRMETMVRSSDGFEISEVDLQLRGPGDITGTQQSGLINLKVADLAKDQKILTAARHAVEAILEDDPQLEKEENQPVKNYLKRISADQPDWSLIS